VLSFSSPAPDEECLYHLLMTGPADIIHQRNDNENNIISPKSRSILFYGWQGQLTPHPCQYIIPSFVESAQEQMPDHKKIERGIENWEMILIDSV
jgi:hypothetical protein